jgi:YidC/Oxa1 family membrane protein insertase
VEPAILGSDGMYYKAPTSPDSVLTYPGTAIEWGGMQSLYFLSVLVPRAGSEFVSARAVLDPNVATMIPKNQWAYYSNVELYGKAFTLQPGQRVSFTYELFAGPKEHKILVAEDHNLARTLFFRSWNWMRGLSLLLMKMLFGIQKAVVNWGVAIIILTIIVRILTFPLVQKGMKSQAKMMAEQARLKPLMDKINEKYKADPQRKQQEIFKLYKEHGVNPFGAFKGCLWMMIQMPIFIGLYYVINNSIELRGAHFLWINDLSQPDRLFRLAGALPLIGNDINLLPLIMAATQILTAKFSMTQSPAAAADPQQAQMQKTMTYFMPVFMLFIFYTMPAGLVLYWTVSNIWQVLQQLWVNKHMPGLRPQAQPSAPAPKKA